jgi:hypothetical protein
MIKAVAEMPGGRKLLVLGLSYANLDKFRAEPRDTFIRVDGKDVGGLPVDIVIFSGETEAHCGEVIEQFIDADTKVHISPRLKS